MDHYEDGSDQEEPTISWDETSHGFYGEASFLNHMSHLEVAQLIGWATHLDGPSSAASPPPNPLIGLSNDPLPESIHNYLQELAVEILQKQEAGQQLLEFQSQVQLSVKSSKSSTATTSSPWEAFDGSAMDAISTVLQEMVTATLLPLAKLHVQRCRRIEQQQPLPAEQHDHGVVAFDDWNLVPEDAIFALINEFGGGSSLPLSPGLATARPAHKTMSSSLNLGVTTSAEPRQEALDHDKALKAWCYTQNLDPTYVQTNKELFQLFLPPSPT